MCRILAYLGSPIPLDQLLLKPDHSLLVQSYAPKELEVALLNADGFGLGWYRAGELPFVYRNILPMWNDGNLANLGRYVRSHSFVSNVRSATPGLPLDFSNCQPFQHGNLLFIHNGYIERFRQTLYRPVRDLIGDTAYQNIYGLTDSEHIFALLTHQLEEQPGLDLADGLTQTIDILKTLADKDGVRVSGTIVVSTGDRLVAARFDNQAKAPTLYWLEKHPDYPGGFILASEPLFEADWTPFPQSHILSVQLEGFPLDDAQLEGAQPGSLRSHRVQSDLKLHTHALTLAV
ncbi:MAG: ergothioneine biosynthesis protein EgtC, partial [Cyanobacteria bacterium P01_D01_bin.44]